MAKRPKSFSRTAAAIIISQYERDWAGRPFQIATGSSPQVKGKVRMSGDFGVQQFQQRQFGHKPSDVIREVSHETVRRTLRLPATGLLGTGLISLVISLGALAYGIVYSGTNRENLQRHWVLQLFGEDAAALRTDRAADQKRIKEEKELQVARANAAFTIVLGGIIVGCLLAAALSMAYVSGGVLMMQLRNYRACRVICVMAMIPVISPLLVLGIPFGIAGFAKLGRPEIRRAFNQV
jgi:hypothetical protein